MLVKLFTNAKALEKYLQGTVIVSTKVVAIYFDAASGKHVLVHNP